MQAITLGRPDYYENIILLIYYQVITSGRLSYTPHSAQTSEYGPVVGLLEHIYRFIK